MPSQLTKKEHRYLKNIARRWKKNQLTAETLQQEIQEKLGDDWNAKEADIRKELDRLVSAAEKAWWKQTWLKNITLVIITVAVIGSFISTSRILLKLNPRVNEVGYELSAIESRLTMIEATPTVEQTATPASPTGVNIAPVSTQVSEMSQQISALKMQVATLSAHDIALSTTVSHLFALSVTPTPTVTVTAITATISVTSTFIGVKSPVTGTEGTLTLSISSGTSPQQFDVTRPFSTAFQLQPDTTYTLTLQSEKYVILNLVSEEGVVKNVGLGSAIVVFTPTQPLSPSLLLREQLSLGVRGKIKNNDGLHMRESPISTDTNIITTLKVNTPFIVWDNNNQGWIYICVPYNNDDLSPCLSKDDTSKEQQWGWVSKEHVVLYGYEN